MCATSPHPIDRRRFLRTGALAGLTATAIVPLTQCARQKPAAAPDSAWKELAANIRGRVLRPGDPGFDRFGMPVNVRFDSVRPAGVAVCSSTEDVSYALRWARDNGVPQVPRSGGHSYAGYSTNDGLVIAVSGMNGVRHDAQADTVIAGGGALNRDVAAALAAPNVMIPGGQCPTVGVAGLTLGGGLGFSMRSLGVTSDSLVSTQVVLANGDVVTASATENPGLFWALRGGTGGNFGVNTEFTYRANPARNCTHFELEFSAARTADTLDAWFTMIAGAPRELGVIWYHEPGATPADAPLCGITGQMYGSASDTRDLLAPVLRAGGPLSAETLVEGSYWDAVEFLATDYAPHAFIDRSRFLDRRFDSDGIGALTARLDQQPHHRGDTSIFAWGGAIGDVAPDATAFVHRSPVALIKYSGVWEPGDTTTGQAATRWVDETFAAMQPHSSARSFQNFPDTALEDWGQSYFGANLARLTEVKRTYDPDRFFAFPQAIPST